jgi:hypothetical protein
MASRKQVVERELGVKVPKQYATYLEEYGIYEAPGVEVYGMSDDLLRFDGPPCVIGATQARRRRDNLPHRFIALQHTGLEDETICLDTEDGTVHSRSRDFGNHKIAESFNEWFERDILNPSEEMQEQREWMGEYWKQRAQGILDRARRQRRRGTKPLPRRAVRTKKK